MIFIDVQIPVSLIDIANSIARAIDPDVGGAETFRVPEDYEGDTLITGLPFFESFAPIVPVLLADPVQLHAFVAADYEKRWASLTPPTIEEVTLFCDVAECLVDDPQTLEIKERDVLLP